MTSLAPQSCPSAIVCCLLRAALTLVASPRPSSTSFGDAGATVLASEIRANSQLQFVRAAGNEIKHEGGQALAVAIADSANDAVLCDVKYNPMDYRDLVAVRLSNERREPEAGVSPLDGWGKQED